MSVAAGLGAVGRRSSLRYMFERWNFTVCSVTHSSRDIAVRRARRDQTEDLSSRRSAPSPRRPGPRAAGHPLAQILVSVNDVSADCLPDQRGKRRGLRRLRDRPTAPASKTASSQTVSSPIVSRMTATVGRSALTLLIRSSARSERSISSISITSGAASTMARHDTLRASTLPKNLNRRSCAGRWRWPRKSMSCLYNN